VAMDKFSKSRVWDKVPEGSILTFGDTQIFLETVLHKSREAFMPKNRAISIPHQLETDGQTHTHTQAHS